MNEKKVQSLKVKPISIHIYGRVIKQFNPAVEIWKLLNWKIKYIFVEAANLTLG